MNTLSFSLLCSIVPLFNAGTLPGTWGFAGKQMDTRPALFLWSGEAE